MTTKFTQPIEGRRDMAPRPSQSYNATSRPNTSETNTTRPNAGYLTQNPKHQSAGRLEGTAYAFGGPPRNIPNHAEKVSRNWHTNSGNTRKADTFRKRRP